MFIFCRQTHMCRGVEAISFLAHFSKKAFNPQSIDIKGISLQRRHDDMEFVKCLGKSFTFLPRL